jgi:hypothetical protein
LSLIGMGSPSVRAVRLACQVCRFTETLDRLPFAFTLGQDRQPVQGKPSRPIPQCPLPVRLSERGREHGQDVVERSDREAFRRGVGGTQILPAGYDRTGRSAREPLTFGGTDCKWIAIGVTSAGQDAS